MKYKNGKVRIKLLELRTLKGRSNLLKLRDLQTQERGVGKVGRLTNR